MSRMSKTAAVALSLMALTAMAPAPATIDTSTNSRVTAPAVPQQQQRTASSQQISARDEVRRVAEISSVVTRYRREWDGKSRTAGDRAHKRMKRSRSSGRR